MSARPTVLLADDDDHLAALVLHALDHDAEIVHVPLHDVGILLRETCWDAVVCTTERPDWYRLGEVLTAPLPAVVLVREDGPDTVLAAVRHGATDALCGDDLSVHTIRRAVLVAVERGHAIAAARAHANAERTIAVGLLASAVGEALRPTLATLSRAVADPASAPDASRTAIASLQEILADLRRANLG